MPFSATYSLGQKTFHLIQRQKGQLGHCSETWSILSPQNKKGMLGAQNLSASQLDLSLVTQTSCHLVLESSGNSGSNVNIGADFAAKLSPVT